MIAKFFWKNNLLQGDTEVKVRTERPGALPFSSTSGAFVVRDARSFEIPDTSYGNALPVYSKY